MPVTPQKAPKKIHINDDVYEFLVALTQPKTIKVGETSLDVYGWNEAMRHAREVIDHKRNNP